MTLGFIGLGDQGAPIARRMIDAGYPVIMWARRSASLEPFADTSAEIASSIAELGARSDHVGICVVDDAGVRQVCDELIPAMRPGSRIAVHSTVHPDLCIALAKEAAARDVALIDAPVSGGSPAAAAGTLTVMVGGDEQVVAAARPIFESFAGLIVHLGGVGAGQMAKLINNSLMAAHLGLAHDAMKAATALGLDRQALIELIKVSSGRSFAFDVYARLPDPSAFAHGAAMLAKDIGLLANVLGSDPHFAAMRDAAEPYLMLVAESAAARAKS